MNSNFSLNRITAHKYLEQHSEYVHEEDRQMYSVVTFEPNMIRSLLYLLYGLPSRFDVNYIDQYLVIHMINGKIMTVVTSVDVTYYMSGIKRLLPHVMQSTFINRPNLQEYFEKNYVFYTGVKYVPKLNEYGHLKP